MVLEGSRVIVQFGKKKVVTGIIAKVHEQPPEIYEAKYLLELLDEVPSINKQQLKLFAWMAEYYMCALGEVINAALPSGLKISSESRIQIHPEAEFDGIDFTEKEQLIVNALITNESMTYDEVAKLINQKSIFNILKTLTAKGAILLYELVKEKYKPKTIKKIRLNDGFNNEESLKILLEELEKKPKQSDVILKYLQHVPIFNHPELNSRGYLKSKIVEAGISTSSLNTLVKKGVMEEFIETVSRFEMPTDDDDEHTIKFNDAQLGARDNILAQFEETDVCLLHGVTGSGKTEIYIDLIQKAMQGGSQVLYLLPEIALTTQIVQRLRKVFGNKMGVYHSRFSANERVDVWKGIISGQFNFIVGVRSSIFLPFDNLGLIIIDEEHDASYKQHDPAPRYNARDVALVLAKSHNAKTLLGSATPSVESYFNAIKGNWGLIKLFDRYGNAKLPDIRLIDTKFRFQKSKTGFTTELIKEIENSLDNKQQVILFQNRRGYSPFMLCHDCGHIPQCKNCNVSMTYHMYSNELRCHYCGHSQTMILKCEACGSDKIKTMGHGTEKIEGDLKLILPEANIQRMDLDTTRRKNSYQEIISAFEIGQTEILIGTQMVSKGLDFGNVSLVGIFDADRMIHFPDFRANERAFQMMMQVSGRAGRKDVPGKVLIQTNDTKQPIFKLIKAHDYERFFYGEIHEREQFKYPPYVRLIQITIKNIDSEISRYTAEQLAKQLQQKFGKVRILGPEPPVVDRVRNQYLNCVMIKLERKRVNLQVAKEEIRKSIDLCKSRKEFKSSFFVVDVDPV